MIARWFLCLSAVAALLAGIVPPAGADVLYMCPISAGGDNIARGFYVENYKGLTLSTVTLGYSTSGEVGEYRTTLAAYAGTYDGTHIGSVDVGFNELGGEVTFDFSDVAVTEGQTIAFVQTQLSGPEGSIVYYSTGPCDFSESCNSCPSVVETEDTTPPLSTLRRKSIGITVVGRASTPVEHRTWGTVRMLYR